MKKIILLSITTFLLIGCKEELNKECESLAKVSEQTDKNINNYKMAWNAFF